MKISHKKTKMILFIPGTARDFHPKFSLKQTQIDLVEETKLLGVIIRSDLSWSSNTEYIVTRANKKLWFLRKLKVLGANQKDLKEVYIKQIRSIVEFAVHNLITVEQRVDIERIKKSALHIILGDKYHSYSSAHKCVGLDTLFRRRQRLCTTFARRCFKNDKFKNWFKPFTKTSQTRQQGRRLCDVHSRTMRFERSPISYITELLNRLKNIK